MAFQITSDAFENDGVVPKKYSCYGDDVPPPLSWNDPPAGTESFVLIMEDLDTGDPPDTSWLVFDLPADSRFLPEAVTSVDDLPEGATFGENSIGMAGFHSPCPRADTHRYVFRLYALDSRLGLTLGATRTEIEAAMDGHVLDTAELTGRYTPE